MFKEIQTQLKRLCSS